MEERAEVVEVYAVEITCIDPVTLAVVRLFVATHAFTVPDTPPG